MAEKKLINTSSAEGGSFEGALTQDVRRFFKASNQWTRARNAVNNTVVGDLGDLSNEASNYLCKAIYDKDGVTPYTIIGAIHIEADDWAVFSTNNVESEIGFFKESQCLYKTLVNNTCLKFSTEHLIKGVGRTAFNCGRRIYWDDGVNPSRVLDIDNIPWIQSCITDPYGCILCTDTNVLDCDKLRMAALVKDLAFRIEIGNSSGQLLNGSYFVVGAYLVEGQRVTDYTLPSNVQGLFNHDNVASALDIYITEADKEFDEFELVIIQFANFNTVARKVGVYSTSQKKITLDHIDERWETMDPGLLLIQNPVPDKSDAIYRSGDYILRVGPTSKFDFNYQPLANQIRAQWVSVEYPADYYKKGGTNTGHMRDEVYPYFIRWVYDTGDKSMSYHIPGRAMKPGEDVPYVNADVLPGEIGVLWKVCNLATEDPNFFLTNPGLQLPLVDGGIVKGGGDMAYWESTEYYDDKHPEIWNATSDLMWGSNNLDHDLCGRHIRHHKFPDNIITNPLTGAVQSTITNHYDPATGETIRIMGVQFTNIKPPLDNNGDRITSIVGYEILRGSREGNKTVLAKGMINNMREYLPLDKNPDKRYLYPNYPYNPTASDKRYKDVLGHYPPVDHFLSSTPTEFDTNAFNAPAVLNDNNAFLRSFNPATNMHVDTPLGGNDGGGHFVDHDNILKDLVTFHGPDTNFRNPFLSAKEVKVYGELHGTMIGQFELPKDHPRHKFITDSAFVVSAIIGFGYGLISMEGDTTTRYKAPQIAYGGTKTDAGTILGTTGLAGLSAIPSALQVVGAGLSNIAEYVTNELLSHTILSGILSAVGINPTGIRDTAMQVAGFISGAIGGQGGSMEYEHSTTPWGATPGILRPIVGSMAFLTFWAEGTDKIIKLIYAFTPYRHYALQQVSHCYYDKFAFPKLGDRRRQIDYQNYLNPGFQEFAQNYRINNLFRPRTVALKLATDLTLPHQLPVDPNNLYAAGHDDTQAIFSDVWDRHGVDADRWKSEDNINASFDRPATSHYVALKQRLDNQYGQLNGIMQVPISTNYTEIVAPFMDPNNQVLPQIPSPVFFGGDIYIGRYTEKNTMFFFYDWLKGQPDGTAFNYKLRKMVIHPRFWMDTDQFDIGEFIQSAFDLISGQNNPPDNFDPFMLAIPNVGICECGTLTNCYFSTTDLTNLCDLEDKLKAAQLYVDFLEDCACFVNRSEEPHCNEDYNDPAKAEIDPISLDDPIGSGNYVYPLTLCPECTSCYDIFSSNTYLDLRAGKFLDENKGRYARKVRKAEKEVKKIQKKINKLKDKLYEDYLSDTEGTNTGNVQSTFNNLALPSDKFAFDMRSPNINGAKLKQFNIKEAWMYLFNSGVRDFYVESEINIDYRDWGEKPEERHYDHHTYTNLKELFSTDHIKTGNFMSYDYSLSISKLFTNYISWGLMQDRYYDPKIAETCYKYRPKRVIYSLPQQLENKKDNWRVFLPLNYKDFNSVTSAIKPIGKNGAILFFKTESPIQFPGIDTLETDAGTKVTIGDGGLFNMPMQNLVNAEYPHEYGSCQDRLSVINTPAGVFYMSQNQGKIFQISASGLREISTNNLKWWFARYLPYQLTQHPTAFLLDPLTGEQKPFDLIDNPVAGIGCQTIYDNENGIVYFCKKDWVIRTDIGYTLSYIHGDLFLVNGLGLKVKLGDPDYFLPASWTISWDPKINEGAGSWLSWHDWFPDLTIPSKHTFLTTKKNGIWVHADRCDSYCNFYGIDYPFEVEFTLLTKGDVNTLRNIMYLMEVYIYGPNCDDRFHDLDFNFDEVIVYNSEQCSGLLKLHLKPKNNAPEIITYPRINFADIDILYSKEEQKYRFNQFWDITDDRGEFNPMVHRTMFITQPNGYIMDLNPNNLNYNKFALERKKFRHYENSVWLSRKVSGNRNIVVSVATQMNLKSER